MILLRSLYKQLEYFAAILLTTKHIAFAIYRQNMSYSNTKQSLYINHCDVQLPTIKVFWCRSLNKISVLKLNFVNGSWHASWMWVITFEICLKKFTKIIKLFFLLFFIIMANQSQPKHFLYHISSLSVFITNKVVRL